MKISSGIMQFVDTNLISTGNEGVCVHQIQICVHRVAVWFWMSIWPDCGGYFGVCCAKYAHKPYDAIRVMIKS